MAASTTSSNGKGDKARPFSVSRETFEANWDAIFAKRSPQPLSSGRPRGIIPGRVLIGGDGAGWEIPDLREILGEEKWTAVQEDIRAADKRT